jgi:MarR-like DNA-binding transcriptional regulator SgrR of sgrS sRNA
MNQRVIRTYMDYAKDLDPARILTISDLEISVALGSTLVTFDKERQLVTGLASKWEFTGPSQIAFTLREGLKWSNGERVTAAEFKAALERAKKDHGKDLNALFGAIVSIEAKGSNLIFNTVGPAVESGVLLKLTEPMYALVALKDGKLDLSRSAGPFRVSKASEKSITLERNTNWYLDGKGVADVVEIRHGGQAANTLKSFRLDRWPNLVSGTSLVESSELAAIEKAGYSKWQRSLDTVFAIFPSAKFLSVGGATTVKALAKALDPSAVLPGYGGFVPADQFFPRGYELWSGKPPEVGATSPAKKARLRVILAGTSYVAHAAKGISASLTKIIGEAPHVEVVSLSEIEGRMRTGDFDLLATGIAVADPNFEGGMSFFFEREPAFIQSLDAPLDFRSQLRSIRRLPSSKERSLKMRDLTIRAQEAGHVLPLFHFSGFAVAKEGLDLSEMPNTDETVTFSKVRFK